MSGQPTMPTVDLEKWALRLNSEVSRLTADNEALRKEWDEAIAAHHRTSHKAVKRLRALWREKQAAESRADALAQEVEKLRIAVVDYLREHDNPAPDYAYRHQLRERLRAALGGRP